VFALAATLGIYLLLPFLEGLSSVARRSVVIRPVRTAQVAPPAPPPRTDRLPEKAEPEIPKPALRQVQRRVPPMQVPVSLAVARGNVGGDFAIDFGIHEAELAGQIRSLVFDLADLDEPPRPVARLKPVYPPQARMRRIEGFVVVEFVVSVDGTAQDVRVVEAKPEDVFGRAAVRAVRRWRFTPGIKDGEPVATRVRQRVSFELE
jgi:protein TonB